MRNPVNDRPTDVGDIRPLRGRIGQQAGVTGRMSSTSVGIFHLFAQSFTVLLLPPRERERETERQRERMVEIEKKRESLKKRE